MAGELRVNIKKFLISNIEYEDKFNEFDFNLEDKDGHFYPEEYYINIQEFMFAHQAQEVTKDFNYYNLEHSYIKTRRGALLINQDLGENLINKMERFSCFIYFITVKKTFKSNSKELADFLVIHKQSENNTGLFSNPDRKHTTVEILIYIGQTKNITERYKDGHKITQKLNDPIYDGCEKKIYLANIWLDQEREFNLPYQHQHGNPPNTEEIPVDSLGPEALVSNILDFLESFLISYFDIPLYNKRNKQPKISFTIDKWKRITIPRRIRISSFDKSLLFENERVIDTDKIDEILAPVYEKNFLP